MRLPFYKFSFKLVILKKLHLIGGEIVMYHEFPAVNLRDWFGLVSVWEQSNQGWRRLCTVRLTDAKKLCNQQNRFIFSTTTDLNKRNELNTDNFKICKIIATQEHLFDIIKKVPGQTSSVLAKKLDMSVPTLRQHLKLLEEAKLIHYCRDSSNKRIKRYYVGEKPTNAETSNKLKKVKPKTKLPIVNVYFVNPKLLQK